MTEYEKAEYLRRMWAPRDEQARRDEDGSGAPLRAHRTAAQRTDDVHYQQCGGGRRVLRKKIGADR